MQVYIKVGERYFIGFGSETKGNTGHTQNGSTTVIKEVVTSSKYKHKHSALGVRNIIGELMELMRFGDITKEDIKIEVVE